MLQLKTPRLSEGLQVVITQNHKEIMGNTLVKIIPVIIMVA